MAQRKATLKKVLIEIAYWECGNPSHRHKTQAVADKCIAIIRQKRTMPSPEERKAKWITALRSVIGGATWKDWVCVIRGC